MVLIVTNKKDYTADFLILQLQKLQAEYVRLNTEDFPKSVGITWRVEESLLEGSLLTSRRRLDLKDVKSVWYRRPMPPVPSNEIKDPAGYEFTIAESQTALDGVLSSLDCFWVSHPDNLRRAENKLYQLKCASRLNFKISPTIVTNIPDVAQSFYSQHAGAVVYKPLRRGKLVRDEAVSLIYTNLVNSDVAEKLDDVAFAPSLLQRYVPKLMEIRVTVIGSRVFAVEIHSQEQSEARHDWRRGNPEELQYAPHILPNDIEIKCVSLVRKLGLAFGAIDLILTPDKEYVFLEINPNGQWAWIQQICPAIPLRETLADLLIRGASTSDV